MIKNELGQRIHQLLLSKNLENPVIFDKIQAWKNKNTELENKFGDFLHELGFDLSNQSVAHTPKRVVEFLTQELFSGLNYENFPQASTIPNEFGYNSPLFSKNIALYSTCEHHLVPIRGMVIVAYIPNNKVIGFSKLTRIVDFFAKRPQMQERLSCQILVVLQEILATQNVAVAINAMHDCMANRGVKDRDSQVLTIETAGLFQTDSILKANFYQQANSLAS
ncbi:MAG: cyclohydrolase [Pseudomonadota bacterium]|nr:cyclohydrolase [Pseudomonadota bacterium]